MSIKDFKNRPALTDEQKEAVSVEAQQERVYVTLDALCVDFAVSLFQAVRQAGQMADLEHDNLAIQRLVYATTELASVFLWPPGAPPVSAAARNEEGFYRIFYTEETPNLLVEKDVVFHAENREQAKMRFLETFKPALNRRYRVIKVEATEDPRQEDS